MATPARSFARILAVSIGARLLVDTGVQLFNPFLPIIANGLGVELVTMGRLLSVQNLTGLISPVLGGLAERRGYRRVMRLSLLSGALGFLAIGLSQHLAVALAGMVLTGLCLAGFIPTMVAYLSARLPYERRARGLGILEYSWALSGIIGMVLVGQLIETWGWRAPFFLLSSGLFMMALVFATLPSAHGEIVDRRECVPEEVPSWPVRTARFFALGSGARSAYATILASTLNFLALMQLNLAYGAWFSDHYGIGAAQLGHVALVLGCFDLCASILVSLFTDRVGKRRSVLLGAGGAMLGYALLPFANVGFTPALLALAATRGFAEFFIVAMISLLSEQAPTQRAKVMTINVAAMQIGFTIAGFSGPWLYTYYGIPGLAFISLTVTLVATIVTLIWVRDAPTVASQPA